MTALAPTPCSCINHRGEKMAKMYVYVGNDSYGVCEDCYKMFGILGQLIIKEHEN